MSDKIREAIARIVGPKAWTQRQRHLDQAEQCEYPDHADQWRVRADDVVRPSLDTADAILAAIPTTDAVDWVMVPRVPTEAMLSAVNREAYAWSYITPARATHAWNAMIAASPTPSTDVGEDEVGPCTCGSPYYDMGTHAGGCPAIRKGER